MALRLPYCWYSGRVFGRLKIKKQTTLSTLLQQAPNHVITRPFLLPSTTNLPLSRPSIRQGTHSPDPKHLLNIRQRSRCTYSTDAKEPSHDKPTNQNSEPAPPKSSTEKVKVILREYGTVALVFHITVSLCSVGTCYVLVSNGLDVDRVLEYFNVGSSGTKKGASTFAIAYVLHKVILPIRAAITVACVPLIVRKMRSMGWMKGMVKNVSNSTKNKVQ